METATDTSTFAGELELRVDSTALAQIKDLRIPANFEEVGIALKEKLLPYSKLVVTAESVPAAKTARASVNRLRLNIDEYRKTIKKMLSAPAAEFDAKCKPLLELCSEASGNIDGQIKELERREKDQKIATLRIFFNQQIGDDGRYLSFESVFNPKWENKSYTEETAKKDIISAITSARADVNAILAIRSPFEAALIDNYAQSHNLAACMQQHERLLQAQKRLEDLRAKTETVAKNAEASMIAAAERATATMQEAASVMRQHDEETTQRSPENLFVVDFRVRATNAQLAKLRDFLHNNGIQYGKVPNGG